MAITYVAGTAASTVADATSTTIAVTLGAAVAVGDVIVGMTGFATGPTVTVADSLGNSYTVNADQINDATNGQSGRTFFSKVTVAGTPTITVTYNVTTTFRRVIAGAWAGSDASPFDTSKGNNQAAPGTGTDACTSTNITTAANNELCVGFYQDTGGAGAITAGTNYTSRNANSTFLMIEDRILATAGLVAATFTHAAPDGATIVHIVAMKELVAGAGDDVLVRYGSMGATDGSGLVMAAFASSSPAAVLGGGAYFLRRRREDALTTWEDL